MFLEMHWVIQSTQLRRHHRYTIQPVQRIMGVKHPSVVLCEIIYSEGPFEVVSFENFALE